MATGIKTGGRIKGVLNKDTAEIRESFQSLIENNIDILQEDIKALKPIERIKVIIDLAKFVLPTLKAIEYNESTDENGIKPVTINIIYPLEDDN
jgi:hypothetical protein